METTNFAAERLFRLKLRALERINIKEDEVVEDFILRCGFPYYVVYGDERDDN